MSLMTTHVLVLPADSLAETVLKVLYDDHGCIHHAGANTGPCRTCKRRAGRLVAALEALAIDELTEDDPGDTEDIIGLEETGLDGVDRVDGT